MAGLEFDNLILEAINAVYKEVQQPGIKSESATSTVFEVIDNSDKHSNQLSALKSNVTKLSQSSKWTKSASKSIFNGS